MKKKFSPQYDLRRSMYDATQDGSDEPRLLGTERDTGWRPIPFQRKLIKEKTLVPGEENEIPDTRKRFSFLKRKKRFVEGE